MIDLRAGLRHSDALSKFDVMVLCKSVVNPRQWRPGTSPDRIKNLFGAIFHSFENTLDRFLLRVV